MGTQWSFCEAAFPFGIVGSSHAAQGLLSQRQLPASMKMDWQAAGDRAGPGLVTFSCLRSFSVNSRKLICYWHLIIAHHKASDVFVGKPLHFPPHLRPVCIRPLQAFCIRCPPAPKWYWCGSVVSTLDCWYGSWLLFSIAFLYMLTRRRMHIYIPNYTYCFYPEVSFIITFICTF